MKKIFSIIYLSLFGLSALAQELPRCVVEDCKGGTWQTGAIHWRIRRLSDSKILEYGPGVAWNDDARRKATLKICHREYLNRVCSTCEMRSMPYKMPACK